MSRKVAIYPGSFDPITLGHLDVLNRAHKMFDEVILLVANSQSKSYLFSAEERVEIVKNAVKHLKNVVVDVYDGLTVEYAKQKKIHILIRGLRGISDFEYEMAIAHVNRKLHPSIETIFVMASEDLGSISSKIVKEVARNNGDISSLVPAVAVKAMKKKLPKMRGKYA